MQRWNDSKRKLPDFKGLGSEKFGCQSWGDQSDKSTRYQNRIPGMILVVCLLQKLCTKIIIIKEDRHKMLE